MNHQTQKEVDIRSIFTRYHGLEIFKAEICNARQRCETLKPQIDAVKEEERPAFAKFYDSKGYVPVHSKRLEFKTPTSRGRQNYFVEINPDFFVDCERDFVVAF